LNIKVLSSELYLYESLSVICFLLVVTCRERVWSKQNCFCYYLNDIVAAPAMAASNTDLSDASSIFNVQDQQVLQLEVLFSEEMKETEGAWFTYALGGLAGMYGSGYGYLAGGAAGLWSPISGVRSAVMTFGGAFTGRAVSSYGSSYGVW
jgi:uncharacterized protein (DUF697 family)